MGKEYQKIPLDTIDYGSNEDFDNSEYVVPADGYYHLSATVSVYLHQRLFIVIKKNGGEVLRGSDPTDGHGSCVSGELHLKAGDRIQFGAWFGEGGLVYGGSPTCVMSIHLFSR